MAFTPNFLNLQDRALTLGNLGEVDRTNIKLFINMAYHDLQGRYRWSWLEDSATVTTVAGTTTVALSGLFPSQDYIAFAKLKPVTNTTIAPEYVDPNSMSDDAFFGKYIDSTEIGIPRYFTIWNRTIYFSPKPAGVYTYTLFCYKQPVELSGNSDEPLVPAAFRDVLVHGALMYHSLRDRNPDMAAYYQGLYDAGIRKLIQMDQVHKSRQSGSHVVLPA